MQFITQSKHTFRRFVAAFQLKWDFDFFIEIGYAYGNGGIADEKSRTLLNEQVSKFRLFKVTRN